jgi:hypothetical protein
MKTDLEQTVKQMSYRELKRKFEEDRRRTEFLFNAILLVMLVFALVMLIAR